MQDDCDFELSIFPRKRLSPRQRQVLDRLLLGDGEKQIASQLRISPHTVHVYVKVLYTVYEVESRAELMALFISPRVRSAVCKPG